MNARLCVFLAFALLQNLAFGQLSFGSATLLDTQWAFALQDDPRASAPDFDDHGWRRVNLPHDWSILAPLSRDLASCTGYLPGGVGWYRKKLSLDPSTANEAVYLYFEGVYNRSEVYVNGQLVGKRPNGYVSFYYDITPYLRAEGENVVAVRVDHSRSADSRWYTGSGIYRNVYFVRAGPVHIAPWGVTVSAAPSHAGSARIQIALQMENRLAENAPVSVRHELLSSDGAVVGAAETRAAVPAKGSATAEATIDLPKARLWSVDDPYLYRLKTTVLRDGKTVDQTTTTTGIRRFDFDPDKGFFLNGVSLKMKGVCLHHDAGVLGAAVSSSIWRQRLRTLKSIGCNAIRTSHNPQAPEFYDLCDELGLLVLDEAFDEWEFPKRKWLTGWNHGEPGFEGSYDFFEEWRNRDLGDMVRRDRNHPSIFAWSIGNEIDYPNDPYSHPILNGSRIDQPMYGGYKPTQPDAKRLGVIAERLAAEVKKHDSSRPVTAALAGVVMSNETGYPGALDVVGYNYTEDRYASDHQKYPQRVIYGSENRHDLNAWKAVRDNPHIFGQFLWTGIDYLGEAGPWPSRGSSAGLLDLTGAVKPRGRFREALWSSKPMVYLGTERPREDDRQSIDARPLWNYEAGSAVRVFCYTNAARVRLLLNGKPLAEEKTLDANAGMIVWDVKFEAGTLEAIGLDAGGAETCRSSLRTAGAPASLALSSEEPSVGRARGVSAIMLQVVDASGVPVVTSSAEVTCRVEGPGRLLGLEAGNLRDMSDYTDAVHAVHHGRMVAYVEATGEPGEIRVRFASKGLPDAVISLRAQ